MNQSIPTVLIIVCVILGLCALIGYLKGFVRKISGIAAFFLSCFLVTALLPTINSALRDTAVYTGIQSQCRTVCDEILRNTISGKAFKLTDVLPFFGKSGNSGSTGPAEGTGSGAGNVQLPSTVTADDGSGSIDRAKVKSLLQNYGFDPSVVDTLSDEELKNYVQQYIGATAGAVQQPLLLVDGAAMPDITAVLLAESAAAAPETAGGNAGSKKSFLSQFTGSMNRSEQIRFIENLKIPQPLKEQLETYNNAEGYERLGADDFGSYLVNYLANLITNAVAFIVTLVVVWILVWILFSALKVFTYLPLVGTADRLLGLVLGLIQGVLIVWLLFLILSMFGSTPAGESMLKEINQNPFLSYLYNSNLFLSSAMTAIKRIM